MVKSFRFWCFVAAMLSFATAVGHVIGGGPEFHDPALASLLSAPWKAAFSTIWHEITALLILNGLFLVAIGMTWRRNQLCLALVLTLNVSFAALFLFYGWVRLADVTVLIQWIAFALISAAIALAMGVASQQMARESLLEQSAFNALPGANFADTYAATGVTFSDAMAATQQVFGRTPNWVTALMALRNALVAPFGLVHAPSQLPNDAKTIGMFPILSSQRERVVLGLDDKHLNFRIVVDLRENQGVLKLTTLVKSNNFFGRIYLFIIKPFHRLIVPAMLSAGVKA